MDLDKILEKIGEKDYELRRIAALKEAECYELTKTAERLSEETLIPFVLVLKKLKAKGMINSSNIKHLGITYSKLDYADDYGFGNTEVVVFYDDASKVTKSGYYRFDSKSVVTYNSTIDNQISALKNIITTLEEIELNFEKDLDTYLNKL